MRGKKSRGISLTKLRIPRRIPTFQKLNSVLLKDMDKRKEKALFLHTQLVAESEAAEVNVSPLRLQWSQLKAWLAQPNSRYKHIYVFLNLLIFLLWLYNIPWWPDLAAECYTESWRDIKIKEEKKQMKRSDEIVRWGRGGGVWWGNPVCCSSWDNQLLSPVPFLKMLHTLVKHTVPPSHCCGNLLYVSFLALL